MRVRYVALLGAAVFLTGCSGGTGDDGTGATGTPTSATSPAQGSPSGSDTGTPAPSGSSALPPGGTAEDPARVDATVDLLDWRRVAGPVEATVTVSAGRTLTVDAGQRRATLTGDHPTVVDAGARGRIGEAQLTPDYALVVVQDRREQRPARATVVDLATGDRQIIDGSSTAPTTTGGTWALAADHALYASYGPGHRYCVASADLATGDTATTWCAPARHGFSNARTSAAGDALLTFDAAQPSCRTVVELTGDAVTPFPGVADCEGWEGVLLSAGRVWGVAPDARHIEASHYYASVGDAYYDLGKGTSGSLLACGDAAYFARDAQGGQPAQVFRWRSEDGLSVVYQAPKGGQGFVATPLRCGGDALTVTALTQGGDEQVTAGLG